jgi:hypothetical protein
MEGAKTMSARGARAASLIVATSLVFARRAGACEKSAIERPSSQGTPVRVPLGPADLGVLPEACEANEVSLETHAALLVATGDLYGNLQAGVGVRGRLVVAERTWISVWSPSLEYRFVANATIESERASLGGTVVGVHHRLPIGARTSVAPFLRLLLPTETGFVRASRWGFEHGVSGTTRLRERLDAVFGLAFPFVSVVNGGKSLSVLGETATVDVVYRPWSTFALAAGAAARFSLADAEPLQAIEPHLAFRVYPYRGLFIVLGAALPVSGRDRTDLGLALSLGYGG